MKYVSKPVEIEAYRFIIKPGSVPDKFMEWAIEEDEGTDDYVLNIPTRSGVQTAKLGDYLIREMDGNGWYPCAASIFEMKYEPKPE